MKEDIVNKLFVIKEKTFSFINEAESLLNRMVLLILLIVFLVWFNLGRIIEFAVSESRIKSNLITRLEDITGKKTEVTGDVIFKSEPEPVVTINNIKIHNKSNLTNEDFVDAQTIKTKPNILRAIIGKVDFDNIYFENIKINVDSGAGDSNEIYKSIEKTFSKHGDFYNKKIIFKNLEVNLYKKNPLSEERPVVRKFNFPELELNPHPEVKGVSYQIKGSYDSRNLREVYYFNFDINKGFGVESDYSGKIYSDNSEIKFTGKLDTREKISFFGKMDGKFSGFTKKLFSVIGFSDQFLNGIKDTEQSKISADYLYDGNKLNINNFVGTGDITSLTLNSKTEILDKHTSSLEIKVDKLDYAQMFKSRAEILSEKKAQKTEQDFKKQLEGYFLFAVGDDVNFNFSLDVPKINFFHDKEGSLYVRAQLKNNQFKITNLKAKLPGDSALNLVGVAEINKSQKQLKGAARIVFAGKNMDELNMALNSDFAKPEQQRFGPFYVDAKAFLYGQNIHFREIVARINDDTFAGQMLIDYSNEFKASAAFNFTNLNIDKYITSSSNANIGIKNVQENTLATKFNFLRTIDSIFDRMDVSLIADNMVKAGHNYNDVSVYAQITPGVTEIKDLYFDSDIMGQVKGNAHLDLTDFQPKLDVNLTMEKYDLDLLIYGEIVNQDDKYNFGGKWSNEKITFEKLGNFQGKLNLKIDEFRIYHFLLKNFAMVSHTQDSKFTIDSARADIFGNKIDIKGILTTEYPSFSLSFVAADLNSKDFMDDTLNLNQLTSTFNMSGVLASTGYSIDQMMQNLKGNISVATKGFTVSGFDFAAAGKALPVAKRREYIRLISDELLSKGTTDFSFFTGIFSIDSGQITFTDISLSSPAVKSMKVSGVIDLPKWQVSIDSDMDVVTSGNDTFHLSGKTSGTIPVLKTIWDNTGMIKYWENRFFGSGVR